MKCYICKGKIDLNNFHKIKKSVFCDKCYVKRKLLSLRLVFANRELEKKGVEQYNLVKNRQNTIPKLTQDIYSLDFMHTKNAKKFLGIVS